MMIKELGTSECFEILKSNHIGRLAYIFENIPYAVPITYFHDAEENCIIGYSAKGHKIDAMQKNGVVTLQVDDIRLIQKWSSVLVHGNYEELAGSTAKKYLHRFAMGVRKILVKESGVKSEFIQDFSSRLQGEMIPIVYRINISDINGKFRNDQNN